MPLAARRRTRREELRALGGVVRLRDDFGKDCRAAQETLQLALQTIEQAEGTLDSLAPRSRRSTRRGPCSTRRRRSRRSRRRLGAVDKARQDRGKLENFLADHAHQARRLLRELGRPEDLDAAEALRLRADLPAIIRALAKQFAALSTQRDEAIKAIARLEDQVERLDRKQAELGEPRDTESLRHAVRQAHKAGDLDDRHDQASAATDQSEKAAARALARLPGWSRPLDDLERLAVPLEATLDRFEAAIQAAEAMLRTLDGKLAAEDEEIGQLEAKIQALNLEQDVPTENDLHAARRRRDEDWKRVRSAWLGGGGDRPRSVPTWPTPSSRARPRPIPWRTVCGVRPTG